MSSTEVELHERLGELDGNCPLYLLHCVRLGIPHRMLMPLRVAVASWSCVHVPRLDHSPRLHSEVP